MNTKMYEDLTQSEIVERTKIHKQNGGRLVSGITMNTGLNFELIGVSETIRFRFSNVVNTTLYNEYLYKFKSYKWNNYKQISFILEIDDAETQILIRYRKPNMKTFKYYLIDFESDFSTMCYKASEFINNL